VDLIQNMVLPPRADLQPNPLSYQVNFHSRDVNPEFIHDFVRQFTS
jgi:hypothetical protein